MSDIVIEEEFKQRNGKVNPETLGYMHGDEDFKTSENEVLQEERMNTEMGRVDTINSKTGSQVNSLK